ncbi:hypothetical protein TWF730_009860 [Orbilia blumenaviensis]|uniref:CBM1 domain-containing protein n=1 Tax=Orbilia blumenaviensis TaxID=1796055 RepID=A0AAV9UWH8_9PEZI
MQFSVVFAVAALASTVAALRPVYSQCGGLYYTGETQCVNTAQCTYVNAYYSQCYPKP